MVKATAFELKLIKFYFDYCFTAYMVNLKVSATSEIGIETANRSVVLKHASRIIQVALFGTKLLYLVCRTTVGDTSSYYFFHSIMILHVATGLYCAVCAIVMSEEALAYFSFNRFVCRKFLGKSICKYNHNCMLCC